MSIFIPFSLMEPISFVSVSLIWNYWVFGFFKFVRMSSLLFKDLIKNIYIYKKIRHNNKTLKKCNDGWLQVTKGQHSWVLPNVLMVYVVFKAWWLPLITNVSIISINLTQWIFQSGEIWVFLTIGKYNLYCILGHNTVETGAVNA